MEKCQKVCTFAPVYRPAPKRSFGTGTWRCRLNRFQMYDKNIHHQDKIADIVAILQSGGLILYPTDTTWGLGCDATQPEAVEKVYALKKTTQPNGLVVLVDSTEMLMRYVTQIHPKIDTLLQFHQRPLTVIYPKSRLLPAQVAAPDGSIAIRITQDPFCKDIIHHLGKPIVASGAHPEGEPWPKNFGHVSFDIIRGVNYVVKYRQDDKRACEPSVMVRLNKEEELDYIRE